MTPLPDDPPRSGVAHVLAKNMNSELRKAQDDLAVAQATIATLKGEKSRLESKITIMERQLADARMLREVRA